MKQRQLEVQCLKWLSVHLERLGSRLIVRRVRESSEVAAAVAAVAESCAASSVHAVRSHDPFTAECDDAAERALRDHGVRPSRGTVVCVRQLCDAY